MYASADKKGKKGPKPHKTLSSFLMPSPSLLSPQQSLSREQVLHTALKASIVAGGDFIDTQIYCFSRRTHEGLVNRPRPIQANSYLLKATSSFFVSCMHLDILVQSLLMIYTQHWAEIGRQRLSINKVPQIATNMTRIVILRTIRRTRQRTMILGHLRATRQAKRDLRRRP